MNIYIIATSLIVVATVSLVIFNFYDITGRFVTSVQNVSGSGNVVAPIEQIRQQSECPQSCDDGNPCTTDWCNGTSNYACSHSPINGTSEGCWGSPTTCSVNTCVSGKCTETQIKNCCGNNICESSESCSSCSNDCGECPVLAPASTQLQTNQQNAQQSNPNTQTQTTQTNQQNTQQTNTQGQTLNHIIISEVQTGPNEFVELYNPTGADLTISGWYLSYYSSSRDWNNTYRNWALPNNTILHAGKFFLINVFNTNNSDWTVLTAEGNPYSGGQISNNGSISIFPFDPRIKTSDGAKNGRIDAVGWNSPVYVFESSPTVTPEDGKSLQRISLTSDTDNNSQDFSLVNSPTPKNSTNQ